MGFELLPPDMPAVVSTAGMPRPLLRAMVESGDYLYLRAGAFTAAPVAGTSWQTDEYLHLARVAAVHRKLQNGAVISHASAALMHGLWLSALPNQVHITQWAKPNGRGAADIRRHSGALRYDDVTAVDGIGVTTIHRTIIDCARTMHPRDALVVADSGIRALTRPDREREHRQESNGRIAVVRKELFAMIGRGPGRRRVRTVLEHADPYAESPRESVLRWIVTAYGLPRPTVQFEVRTPKGRFFCDLGWHWQVRRPDGRVETWLLLVEYDGDIKYLPGGGLVTDDRDAAVVLLKEKEREDAIRAAPGTRMLRTVKADLRDPESLRDRLLAAMPPDIRRTLDPIPHLLFPPARC